MTKPGFSVLGMILKGYPRISETFILNEISLLEEMGLSIHIFSMRRPRESFSHDIVKKIKARVDYLPETFLASLSLLLPPNLLLAAKSPESYKAAFTTACRRFLRSKKMATLKHFLQAGYLVEKLLPASNVSHFHAHFAHSPASVAFFASLLCGIPFSFTAHAKDIYTSNPDQLAEKMDMASFVVTCTEYNKNYLSRITNVSKTSVYRIYHGIDIELFSNRSVNISPGPPYRILTVSRLTAKKGLPTVFRALGILRDKGISFHHTLIGDGEDRKEILELVRSLELDSHTRWLGTLAHDVVIEEYRNADIFVIGCEIAANGDRDGIPNVCVESMAMGTPVVATRVSAIPELIENGKTGLLVEPANPAEMATAIERLLTDKELRKNIIHSARTRVCNDFNNRSLIKNLAALYSARGFKFYSLQSL